MCFEKLKRFKILLNILINTQIDGEWKSFDEQKHGILDGNPIQTIEVIDGVPLWLWATVSFLTILSIIYTIAIAVFNIVKRADR